MFFRYIKWILSVLFISSIFFVNQNTSTGCDSCGIGGFGGGQGGLRGQSAFSAQTQEKKQLSIGFLYEHQDWKHSDPLKSHLKHDEGRHGHSRKSDSIYNTIIGYGVTDKLTLTLQLPFITRKMRQTEDLDFLGQSERSTGQGDTIAFGKYRFYDKLFGATAILGVKAPTGRTTETDRQGEKFEPEEQPGTGSTDFLFGLAVNKTIGKFTANGSVLYQLKGSGTQEYEFGNVVRTSLMGAYTIKERGKYPGIQLLSGVNAQFMDKDQENYERVSDSGGTTVFFSPGLSSQFTDKLSASAAIMLPVIQNLGRDHQEVNSNILISIGYSF
ncbi:MAG: transporter [Candidatus Scalindua sp.]|nr:transporter [Candidatus Scalindua sp.]